MPRWARTKQRNHFPGTGQKAGLNPSPEGDRVTQWGRWLEVRRMEGHRSPVFHTTPEWGGSNVPGGPPLGNQGLGLVWMRLTQSSSVSSLWIPDGEE